MYNKVAAFIKLEARRRIKKNLFTSLMPIKVSYLSRMKMRNITTKIPLTIEIFGVGLKTTNKQSMKMKMAARRE